LKHIFTSLSKTFVHNQAAVVSGEFHHQAKERVLASSGKMM